MKLDGVFHAYEVMIQPFSKDKLWRLQICAAGNGMVYKSTAAAHWAG